MILMQTQLDKEWTWQSQKSHHYVYNKQIHWMWHQAGTSSDMKDSLASLEPVNSRKCNENMAIGDQTMKSVASTTSADTDECSL